jgi:hypothetical protein
VQAVRAQRHVTHRLRNFLSRLKAQDRDLIYEAPQSGWGGGHQKYISRRNSSQSCRKYRTDLDLNMSGIKADAEEQMGEQFEDKGG